MSKRKIIHAAILIAALITSIAGGTVVAQAADQYSAFTTEIATAETAYQQAADHLKETIQAIPDGELINADLKSTASQELNEQPASYELDPNLEKVLSLVGITPEYPIWNDQQQELHTWYDDQTAALTDAAAGLQADHDAWILQQAKNNLTSVIKSVQDTMKTIGSELTKPELSENLSNKIADITASLDAATDPESLHTYAADLQADIKNLQADHDAYIAQKEKEAAEAAARKKAAEQAAANTWTVSYVPSYGTAAAPADGSVGEWQTGYYIAHDWSANGRRIASKPAHVIVNGQVYHYVSSMVVPPDTSWASVTDFVYANGGIGFQTCYGENRLITHYEPGK